MKRLCYILIITPLLLAISCKPGPHSENSFNPVFSTYNSDSTVKQSQPEKNEIFYGILTPVEICAIFNRLDVPYEEATLNPISNRDHYQSISKAALNTGIYGVDFGYLKSFGVSQEMINYMVTINYLSDILGIPDQYLTEPLRKIQREMADPDTIMNLMNSTFHKMEVHLSEGERESTAGLIVLGGWVEALYLATQLVYDPLNPDPEVVQKIAEQKFTLTTLLSFLKNYYDDPVVDNFTMKLMFLKGYFDTFDIYFKPGDLEIDRSKQIFRSSESEMNITVQTLNNIRDYVNKLRTEMVTP